MRFLFDFVMNFIFFGLAGIATLGLAHYLFPQDMTFVIVGFAILTVALGVYFVCKGRRGAPDITDGPSP